MQRVIFIIAILTCALDAQTFRSDDPLEHDLRPVNVTAVASRKLSDYFDAVSHTVHTPGELNRARKQPVKSLGINTLGEPLQGAWWVKRHYYKRMSKEQLVAGAGDAHPPSSEGPWTVVGAKNEGVTPGFVMVDASGQVYFVKFDPVTNPEMATGADYIAMRLLYALGYHVPENYLIEFPSDKLAIGQDTTIADRLGRRRLMTMRDLNELLLKVPKTRGGLYRATASRAIAGRAIGPYRYYGMRHDDPNDYVPHEHRRDLRGLSVISAWIGHDDSRAINTFDAIVEENGLRFVKHYILDLGSTLGSGTQQPNSARSGGEYLFGWKQSATQLLSLGLVAPPWTRADFPKLPSVGRFEHQMFDPERWVPEYPNPAFMNRLPDDEFWAARQIMAFRDEDIRAIVESARYSDPRASAWIAECLIRRRDKIGRAFFGKVLPIDHFEIRNGKLHFDDLAESSHLEGAGPYSVEWLRLNNETGQNARLPGAPNFTLPSAEAGEYMVARIRSSSRPSQVVDLALRRAGAGTPVIVGIDRHCAATAHPDQSNLQTTRRKQQ